MSYKLVCNLNVYLICSTGLRGAISYALSLHLEFSDETRHVIITTTLIIVLVTTLLFGGSTMPILKVIEIIFFFNFFARGLSR